MPWIVGLVTRDELKRLRSVGWEDEDPPILVPEDHSDASDLTMRAFFVDNDVIDIMSGPGWDKVPETVENE